MFLKKLGIAFISLLLAVLITLSASPVQALGDNAWTGAGDGANWSDAANWSKALEAGDHLRFDISNTNEDGVTNDATNVQLGGITFTGELPHMFGITGNPIGLGGFISNQASVSIVDTEVNATNKLYMYNYGEGLMLFTQTIYVYGNNMALRSHDQGQIQIAGTVRGTSTVYISGDSPYGTYIAPTGYIRPKTVVNDGGFLLGQGKVNALNVTASSYLEALTCFTTGNLNIDGTLFFHLGGSAACGGYSQIVTKGTVNVGGATLYAADILVEGYKPAKGSKYVLVSNDGTDKVVGTFRGKAEGATFKANGYTFRISYRGGTGNDIVLTRI